MQIERKTDGRDQRRILIGMITNDQVLAKIAQLWTPPGLFGSKWANLTGGWCVDHYNQYGRAPGKAIESRFEHWADSEDSVETIDLISKFLAGLSAEYEQESPLSSEYIVDLAADYFNRVRVRDLVARLQHCLNRGESGQASEAINDFTRLDVGQGSCINVLTDKEAIKAAFTRREESLIRYPGPVGKFFGGCWERDGFVSFMGPEKRGKSFMLLDVAWRGMLSRHRVAMVICGDLSQDQAMRRIMTRAAQRPLDPCTIRYPIAIKWVDEGTRNAKVKVKHRSQSFEEKLRWNLAVRSCDKIIKRKLRTDEDLLKMMIHPSYTISTAGIRSILKTWEREEGWVPDIVCIDYADVLAPPPGVQDPREQINVSWMQLRAISQEMHCLVVTATQSDAASYTVDTMKMSHFTNDKRKLAHVTGMIGLNQTEDEKHDDLMRLNWIVLREGSFLTSKCAYIAGCRHLANPSIISVF